MTRYEVLVHHASATFCGGFAQGLHPWGERECRPEFGVYLTDLLPPFGEIDYEITIDTDAGPITFMRSQLQG